MQNIKFFPKIKTSKFRSNDEKIVLSFSDSHVAQIEVSAN